MSDEPFILPREQHELSRQLIDENSLKVLYRLRQHGYTAYLVGGGVRDLLLGRHPKDFDVGTNATPDQVRKLFRNCRLVGRRFRLAHILFGRDERVEVATFRRKPEADECPQDDPFFSENVFGTPQQDAFRRDFTINALFYNIEDFSIIDYVGGLDDLRAGRIRVIGDADERFAEDPVRMLRALEFSARLGFEMDETIAPAIVRNAERLMAVPPARIREELMELFRHKVAGKVLQRAEKVGLLPWLLPEFTSQRESFNFLRQLDLRTAAGTPIEEHVALAALYLVPFREACEGCPDDLNVAEVHKLANRYLVGHCQRFGMAAGLRHLARELFVAFFRFQRGRGRRGEQRFLRHPFTVQSFDFYRLWCEASGQPAELWQCWEAAVKGEEPEGSGGLKRPKRRRRPRRRPPRPKPAPAS
ncbi:MAG: polynucleotide adenylyltransferase PcnB [Desulfuromonadaceae bacterium]|nr:polynucleotide adenylyltransferase PcnB [Desulfuromonadaceae bacterium]